MLEFALVFSSQITIIRFFSNIIYSSLKKAGTKPAFFNSGIIPNHDY
jgi:hypothetical protein